MRTGMLDEIMVRTARRLPDRGLTSIADVLERFDASVTRARAENSRVAYFAVLYKLTTLAVRDSLATQFEDPSARRALRLFNFGGGYIDALEHFPAQRGHTAGVDGVVSGRERLATGGRATPAARDERAHQFRSRHRCRARCARAPSCPRSALTSI